MKTRGCLVGILLCCIVLPSTIHAQCGGTVQAVTYDTTVTGNSDMQVDPYVFTFPRFDGALGTLMSVDIRSVVSLNYGFSVENQENNTKLFRLRLMRMDDVLSPVLMSPISTTSMLPNPPQWYGNVTIGANDNVPGSGDDYSQAAPFSVLSSQTVINQPGNTANFIGSGTVSFDYYTSLFPTLSTSGILFDGAAQDQITFSVTYTYCDNIVMNSANNNNSAQRTPRAEVKNRLYPNPSYSGNFTIEFDNENRGDWQVEIYGPSGNLISRKLFYNSLKANINNDNKLAKGIYLVKAMNIRSNDGFIDRLVVR